MDSLLCNVLVAVSHHEHEQDDATDDVCGDKIVILVLIAVIVMGIEAVVNLGGGKQGSVDPRLKCISIRGPIDRSSQG